MRTKYYAWWIVAASTSSQFLFAALWLQAYGAYVVLLQQEFGWSKALMSTAFAMAQIVSGLIAPIQGWLLDRFGSRLLAGLGTVTFGLGLIALSQVDSLLSFYFAFGVTAIGNSMGGFLTLMPTVVNWFNRHRAKALTITQAGFSLGGLSVPALIFVLEALGWRATAFISGLVMLVFAIPLVLVFQHRPTSRFYIDGGIGIGAHADRPNAPSQPHPQKTDFTVRQALRTAAFWLLSLGHGIALLSVTAVGVHLIPHLTESLGYTLIQAGWIVGLMTSFQLLGHLAGILFGDRFNKVLICTLCMFGHGAALLLLGFASNLPMVLLFALLHGMAWGLRGPLMVALRADYFGPSSFGKIMGISALVVMGGMAIGPVVVGVLADLYGSYRIGFVSLAGVVLLGSLCFILARPPKSPTA